MWIRTPAGLDVVNEVCGGQGKVAPAPGAAAGLHSYAEAARAEPAMLPGYAARDALASLTDVARTG